jgi:F-type H+-transporting ATPase subunit a
MAEPGHGTTNNIGDKIIEHVANSHEMIHLELFGVDLSITKHVIMLWISAGVLLTLALYATRRYRKEERPVPTGFANAFEYVVDFVRTGILIPTMGKNHVMKWGPLVMSFFFLILTMNFLGLVPIFNYINHGHGGTTATGNFTVTASLAIITFFSIIIAGIAEHGFFKHWKNMIPGNVPKPVLLILIPIEIMGMFVRPFALTMRLAANMTAGHIAMLAIFAPIFLMHNAYVGVASVTLNVGITFLEMIVCVVQAYVFTLLTSVFIGQSIHPHH